MTDWTRRELLAAGSLATLAGCAGPGERADAAQWERLTAAAPYPGSYNFPVHVLDDGRFVALHPEGIWSSRDGADWIREPIPPSGANNTYFGHVRHAGASWALAQVTGNYENFALEPLVRRTADFRAWETLGRSATLPRLVFPAVASFGGALWLLGGFDGTQANKAIWRSTDGLAWERAVAAAPWSPRQGSRVLAFRDRLWLFGGGPIDGAINSDVWSSPDGLTWRRETERVADPQPFGFTPQAYADRLWLVGANRSGSFRSEMLVSDDGREWRPMRAPWSPRGAPATWTDGRRMFLTGGKYSTPDPATGQPRFIYSNDVWAMSA